jgi:hypothetical protein
MRPEDMFTVFTFHTETQGEGGDGDGADDPRVDGPYDMAGLWERWGTQGTRRDTWVHWRRFKVRSHPAPGGVKLTGVHPLPMSCTTVPTRR